MAGEEERLLPLCLFMSMHDLGKIVHPAQRAIHFPCKTKRSANNVPGRAASRGCTPPPWGNNQCSQCHRLQRNPLRPPRTRFYLNYEF